MGNSEYIDYEFSLREFVESVLKKKKLALSVFIVVVICSTIISYLLPKTYESRAIIERGSLNGVILSHPETRTILTSKYFLEPVFKKMNIAPSDEGKLMQGIGLEDINDTDYFVLKIRLRDKELCYLLIQEIINLYIEHGNTLYDSRYDFVKNNISHIESLIEKTKLGIDRDSTNKKGSTLSIIFPDNKVQLKDLLTQKFQLENQLLLAKKFKIIDKPIKPVNPVSPNKRMILISSCIIGLFLGVFAAIY